MDIVPSPPFNATQSIHFSCFFTLNFLLKYCIECLSMSLLDVLCQVLKSCNFLNSSLNCFNICSISPARRDHTAHWKERNQGFSCAQLKGWFSYYVLNKLTFDFLLIYLCYFLPPHLTLRMDMQEIRFRGQLASKSQAPANCKQQIPAMYPASLSHPAVPAHTELSQSCRIFKLNLSLTPILIFCFDQLYLNVTSSLPHRGSFCCSEGRWYKRTHYYREETGTPGHCW